jgi:hypothetical protein
MGGGHTFGTPPRRPYLWYAADPKDQDPKTKPTRKRLTRAQKAAIVFTPFKEVITECNWQTLAFIWTKEVGRPPLK